MTFNFPIQQRITQAAIIVGVLGAASVAQADPIEGKWGYYEKQKLAYIVTVKNTAQGLVGVVSGGKKFVGQTVLKGVAAQGKGYYGGGQAFNPMDGSNYNVYLNLNGDKLTMRAYKGLPVFGVTQTFYRLQ